MHAMIFAPEDVAPTFSRLYRRFLIGRASILLTLSSLLCCSTRADLWCTGYYPGWEQGGMPASAIDFTALTHIIHFSAVPNSNGTLDTSINGLTAGNSANIVTNAHAAGRKVLFCVGGAGSQAGFQGATTAGNRGTFITNLVNLMTGRGYDGIDVDWEPLDPTDGQQFTNFINGLRLTMNSVSTQKLLTAAIASPPTPASLIATVKNQFDQIN